jgi:hypothetical protein
MTMVELCENFLFSKLLMSPTIYCEEFIIDFRFLDDKINFFVKKILYFEYPFYRL